MGSLKTPSLNSHRKTKNQPLFYRKKFVPHLYAKKWGFGRVFWRMIYSLFTEIAPTNKKYAFRRKVKVVWDVLTQTS